MNRVKVTMFEGMGRGVQAFTSIFPGEVVMTCELLVLSPEDTVKVNETELHHYTFRYNDTQDCLVLGLGELFNHDDMPNTKYSLEVIDGRHMMVFTALRQLYAGEQLFINYAADVPVEVSSYTTSKSMIG